MIELKDILSDALSLISVASEDWLNEEKDKFKKSVKDIDKYKLEKNKNNNLKLIKDKGKRINEVDAKIELLKVIPKEYKDVEPYLIQLKEIRKKLLYERR